MMTIVDMIDATHVNVGSIPTAAVKVAGYVTGTPDIAWTAGDWGKFPHAGQVRIDQGGPGSPVQPLNVADVYDVEAGAWQPGQIPALVKARHGTTVYGSDGELSAVASALQAALGPPPWPCDCWLANWNLSRAQAAALVGVTVHGMPCKAVQWASPSSNPDTPVPGSGVLLSAAQVDLSVADAAWHPAPAPVKQSYIVVREADLHTTVQHSGDVLP
jgi:hypothetical protein